MRGLVSNIQRFSIHDGPGIRTTVFLIGCSLRCFWCQNPECISPKLGIQYFPNRCIACGQCVVTCPQEAHLIEDGKHVFLRERCISCGKCTEACSSKALMLTGKVMSVEQVVEEVLRDKIFYELSGGGVTLSGGEPLMQRDFSRAILKRCKANGVHTAIETAANCSWEDLSKLLSVTDFIILDIKHIDPNKHRKATGVSNERVLDNAKHLARTNKPTIIRIPIIPTVNDTPTVIGAIARFVAQVGFRNLQYLELLPFHRLGESKYHSLGLNYQASNLKTPTKEKMNRLASKARECGIEVRTG